MKLKSHWYSQISWIIGAYEGRISWIFGALELRIYWIIANLQDIRSLWSVKFPDIWGLWSMTIQDICKSPGYLGPRASTKGQVGKSCTIVPAIAWSVFCTLVKTGSKILHTSKEAKFRPFVDALLGPMNRESPGYLGPMKHKSPVYLQISGTFRAHEAQITCIFANLILIQGLGSENLLDNCKSPGWLQISWMIANLLDDCKSPGYSGPMKHKSHVHFRIS